MQSETHIEMCENIVVQAPAVLQRRKNEYGSVPGLPDEELADPDELERQVYMEEYGPVLALPIRGKRRSIQPAVDESGGVDWGAFGTVDFERGMPAFNKTQYKADRLREEVKDVTILVGIAVRHLPGNVSRLVLKYLRKGIIELDHIVDVDMLILARLCLRAWRLQGEIARLSKAGARHRQEELATLCG